ncbi:recombinase family protein, partial [Rhizobium ruizarguesonis]
ARQADSDIDVRTLIEAISAGQKENLDSRIAVADWIRSNVQQMKIYPDGRDGTQREIDRMSASLEPDVDKLLEASIAFTKRNNALV